MIATEYYGELGFQIWEIAFLPFLFILIYMVSTLIKKNGLVHNECYKYYTMGLWAKLAGSFIFCFLYIYYYGGGDTTAYYESAYSFVKLFEQSPGDFYSVLLSSPTVELRSLFTSETGYPLKYLYFDPNTLMVIRIVSLFLIVTFKSYLLSSLLIAWVTYIGAWRAYLLFDSYYPQLKGQLAIAFLFLPSVLFWGSGILKDTFTFAATCWFIVSFHHVFIKRHKLFINVINLLLSLLLVVSIKPYIMIALFPGALNWWLLARIIKVRNQLVMVILIPMVYLVTVGAGVAFMATFGDSLGDYAPDKILDKAIATQEDLKRDYYEGASFDIGNLEASAGSIIRLVPKAIEAGLFRPYIWEANSPVMLISGVENMFFLVLMIIAAVRIKFTRIGLMIKVLFANPIIMFALSYSLLFALSVGITTSNFGALVRFKIPFLPYFVAGLYMIIYHFKNKLIIQEIEPDPSISMASAQDVPDEEPQE